VETTLETRFFIPLGLTSELANEEVKEETKWNWVRDGYIIFLNFDLKIHEEPGSFFFCAMVRSNYPAAYAPSVAPLWHLTA